MKLITNNEELRNNYDVIVIGAGFAGVTTARVFGETGQSVLVVEAR